MLKVFIADDHAMMREGLKRIIDCTNEMRVHEEAVDGDEVLEKVHGTICDILMLDVTMPGVAGIELIKRVKTCRPELPVLILSMHNIEKIAAAALKAGASGYLTKDSDPDRLIEGIRTISRGGQYVDPVIAAKIIQGGTEKQPHEYLSAREHEIFLMIVAGRSTGQIAEELFLSAKTVSTHKKRIMEKMGVDNAADLIRYATKHHLHE